MTKPQALSDEQLELLRTVPRRNTRLTDSSTPSKEQERSE